MRWNTSASRVDLLPASPRQSKEIRKPAFLSDRLEGHPDIFGNDQANLADNVFVGPKTSLIIFLPKRGELKGCLLQRLTPYRWADGHRANDLPREQPELGQ